MDKVVASAPAEAVADIRDGATLAVGGFGLCGIPIARSDALHERAGHDLTIGRTTAAWTTSTGRPAGRRADHPDDQLYVGENKEFARLYLSGELEVELTPQGTLAERLRAGGVGIPAFYTPTGVGTMVAEGGLPWRYNADGTVALSSPAKEVRVRRPRVRAGGGYRRLRAGPRRGRRPAREPRLPRVGAELQPALRDGRAHHDRRGRGLVEPGEILPEQVHTPGVSSSGWSGRRIGRHRARIGTPDHAPEGGLDNGPHPHAARRPRRAGA